MKKPEGKKQIIKKMVSALADKEAREWPPLCLGFLYQPKRPVTRLSAESEIGETELKHKRS